MLLTILFLVNGELVEIFGWGPREAPSEEVCELWRENVVNYLILVGYDSEAVVVQCLK